MTAGRPGAGGERPRVRSASALTRSRIASVDGCAHQQSDAERGPQALDADTRKVQENDRLPMRQHHVSRHRSLQVMERRLEIVPGPVGPRAWRHSRNFALQPKQIQQLPANSISHM